MFVFVITRCQSNQKPAIARQFGEVPSQAANVHAVRPTACSAGSLDTTPSPSGVGHSGSATFSLDSVPSESLVDLIHFLHRLSSPDVLWVLAESAENYADFRFAI